MARQQLSAELEINAGLGAGFNRVFDRFDQRVDKTMRGLKGFNDRIAGMPKGRIVAGLGRGFDKLTGIFRNTNKEIGRTHDSIGALRKQGRIYENLADHARKMGKAVQPWLTKIDKVNNELDKQERKLNSLRKARERLNRATTGFATVRERAAPGLRRAGYAAAGAAIGTGYAAARSFQKYSDFDVTLNTLVAEGVSETDIPAIRDQVLKFAGETRFTALEIGDLLVSMKKDGQEITSELKGFGNLLKFAVAENKDINTAWNVTRTYINATHTPLENAIKLQEELSNATSLSKLQIEDYGFIAGKALSTFANLENFNTRGFNALAGLLADTGVQVETVGITLRRFPLVLAEAAHGKLGGEKQGLFDALGIDIANEKGELKDIVTILSEFNRVFTEQGFITDENKISTIGLTQLGGIFDTRYADAIGKMITGYKKVEKNIEGVGKIGTLDEKFAVHSKTLFAAQKRFESSVESLGLRLFTIFDDNDNFIKIFDGMTASINRFVGFVEKHKEAISEFASGFVRALGRIGETAINIGRNIFNYFQARGPAIKKFFIDYWAELKGVWATLKPIVMGVLAGLRGIFDVAGKLGGGNTKLLAWLTMAFIGWKALKTPVLAASAAFNLVLGSIGKVKAAWIGLQGLDAVNPLGTSPVPVTGKRGPVTGKGGGWGRAAKTVAPVPMVKTWGKPIGTATKKANIFSRTLAKIKLPKLGIFAKIGSILLRIGPIVAGIGTKFAFLLPILAGVGKAVMAVLGAVGTAVAGITAPVWGIIAAIAAVAVGVVALIVANWDKVKNLFKETLESLKVLGSAIWETLKWIGGSISGFLGSVFRGAVVVIKGVDNFLKKFGIDIVGVFKGLGGFFSSLWSGIWKGAKWLFGGLWNIIKSVGKFLKDQFGHLLDWVSGLHDKFQKFVGGWRDFFKKKNKDRELEENPAGIKVALPEPITPDVNDGIAGVSFENKEMPDFFKDMKTPDFKFEMESPTVVEIDDVTQKITQDLNETKLNIPDDATQKITQTLNAIETKTPVDKTQNITQVWAGLKEAELKTPKDTTQKITQELQASKPEVSDISKPVSQLQTVSTDTIEYVNFKGVDELDQTLKSGFTSLLHVEDEILAVLKKGDFVSDMPRGKNSPSVPDLKMPAIETPTLIVEESHKPVSVEKILETTRIEKETQIEIGRYEAPELRPITLEKPILETLKVEKPDAIKIDKPDTIRIDEPILKTPEANIDLNMPPAPDLKLPALEKPTLETLKIEKPDAIRIDEPVLKTPEATLKLDMPPAPDLKMPALEKPQVDAIESPTFDAIKIDEPVLKTPEATLNLEMPPAPDLKMPALEKPQVDAIESPTFDAIKIDEPVLKTPEATLNLEMPPAPDLKLPALEKPDAIRIDEPVLKTPEAMVNLDMPPAPDLKMPAIEKPKTLKIEKPDTIRIDEPVLRTPEATLKLDMPPAPDLKMPAIEKPTLETLKIEKPDAIRIDEPVLKTPEATLKLDMPPAPDLKLPALEKPDAIRIDEPVLKTPEATLKLDMPPAPDLKMPAIEKPTLETLKIEKPDAIRIDEPVLKTPEATLKLDMPPAPDLKLPAIEKPDAIRIDEPVLKTPEATLKLDMPTAPDLKLPAPDLKLPAIEKPDAIRIDEPVLKTPEATLKLDMPTAPDLKLPAIEKPDAIRIDEPVLKTPEATLKLDMPPAPDLKMPALEKPQVDAIESPTFDAIKIDEPVLKTPEATLNLEMPPAPDLKLPALEKPDAIRIDEPVLRTPEANINLDMPPAPDLKLPALEKPQVDAIESPTFDAIRIDEPVLKTPEAMVNLDMPTAPDLKMPALEKPDTIKIEEPVLKTPEAMVNLDMPTAPDLKMPALEKPNAIKIDEPILKTPEAIERTQTESLLYKETESKLISEKLTIREQVKTELDTQPIAPLKLVEMAEISHDIPAIETPAAPELSALEIPAIEKMEFDELTLNVPDIDTLQVQTPDLMISDLPALETLKFEKPPVAGFDMPPNTFIERRETFDIASPVIPPARDSEFGEIAIPQPKPMSVPALHQTENNYSESKGGDNVEQNITINVHQQDGQDAEELTAVIVKELEKAQRTGYYD